MTSILRHISGVLAELNYRRYVAKLILSTVLPRALGRDFVAC